MILPSARFVADVMSNRHNAQILRRWPDLGLPQAWLVAGCLFQTVWNRLSGRPPEADIKDYDIFYFEPLGDPSGDEPAVDRSAERERAAQARADALFADLGITVEVSNQARVHLWYPAHFGKPYPRLHRVEDGIDRFLVPSTCVGIRPDGIYAPNGLASLYSGDLAMNPLTPHRELFEAKAASYRRRWPWLRWIEPNPPDVGD